MTGNPARFAVASSGATRLPCNDHTTKSLLDAANAALLLDDAGAGVIRAEVTEYGATLHLQQPPPAELGLYVTESRQVIGLSNPRRVVRIGRADFRGVTLEWVVAS